MGNRCVRTKCMIRNEKDASTQRRFIFRFGAFSSSSVVRIFLPPFCPSAKGLFFCSIYKVSEVSTVSFYSKNMGLWIGALKNGCVRMCLERRTLSPHLPCTGLAPTDLRSVGAPSRRANHSNRSDAPNVSSKARRASASGGSVQSRSLPSFDFAVSRPSARPDATMVRCEALALNTRFALRNRS